MTKNKKNIAVAVAFALGAFAAPLMARAASTVIETNKIWEVIQVSESGDYAASQSITFKMRLVSPTYGAPGDAEHPRFQWTVRRNPMIWPGM